MPGRLSGHALTIQPDIRMMMCGSPLHCALCSKSTPSGSPHHPLHDKKRCCCRPNRHQCQGQTPLEAVAGQRHPGSHRPSPRVVGQYGRGAELTQRPHPGQEKTRQKTSPSQRKRNTPEHGPRRLPQSRSRLLQLDIHPAEGALRGYHHERRRRKGLCENHSRPTPRESHSQRLQPATQHAPRTHHQEQEQTSYHRGHDQGQQHSSSKKTCTLELLAGEHVAERDTQGAGYDRSERGRHRREPQCPPGREILDHLQDIRKGKSREKCPKRYNQIQEKQRGQTQDHPPEDYIPCTSLFSHLTPHPPFPHAAA